MSFKINYKLFSPKIKRKRTCQKPLSCPLPCLLLKVTAVLNFMGIMDLLLAMVPSLPLNTTVNRERDSVIS